RRVDQHHSRAGRDEPPEARKPETQDHDPAVPARRDDCQGVGPMTSSNDTTRGGPLTDRMNSAIRENPLAAGLIGVGVAWMLFGGPKGFGAVASGISAAGRSVGSAANAAGTAVAGGLTSVGSAAARGLKDAGGQIADTIPSIVPDLP